MSGQQRAEGGEKEAGAGPREAETVGTLTRVADGREFSLGFGSLRVGRQQRADLVIDDPTVSRHHADVCYESGRYVVYDHSSNGTWVNGQAVPVARALRDSDTVKFGEVEFRFSLKPMDRTTAARLAQEGAPGAAHAETTHIIREDKRRRRRRAGLLLAFVVFILLLAVVGLAIYFLFPGVMDRVLDVAPRAN